MSEALTTSSSSLVGDAARAVADAAAKAIREWERAAEAQRQRRLAERLVEERLQLTADVSNLLRTLDQLISQSHADAIAISLVELQAQAQRCRTANPTDLEKVADLRAQLRRIERSTKRARKQLEAAQLSHALSGVAGQLQALTAQVHGLDQSESRRFDAAGNDRLMNQLTAVERCLASQNVDCASDALTSAAKLLEEHVERVAAGREEHERQRTIARKVADVVGDRFAAVSEDPQFAGLLKEKLIALEPDLAILNRLMAEQQFENVHVQVRRLEQRLEQLTATVRAELQQREGQRAVAQRLIQAMLTQKGTLIGGSADGTISGRTELHFRIPNHGVIHVQIAADGKLSVCADGFNKSQRRVGSIVEKDYSEFVAWFEHIRAAARAQGLEVGEPSWEGKPSPERTGGAKAPTVQRHYETSKPQHRQRSH